MARCENLAGCSFYQGDMKIDSGIGQMYVRKYCEGDKTTCAIYQVASAVGKEHVDLTLYPNMNDKAEKIIKEFS